MTWEEVVSGCLAVGFALAFSTGLAHKVYRGFTMRLWKNGSGTRIASFVEVWECTHCHRLNTIGQSCKHCGDSMPAHPRFKTVPESRLLRFLQPSDDSHRNNPPGAI